MVAVSSAVVTREKKEDEDSRKPPVSGFNLILMNLGFFGVQFSFGLTTSAINPLFMLIGANPHDLPILNIAGPITGLIIQPLIGAISDRTWTDRWGRRKPYIIGGAITCVIVLALFPFVSVLWVAVLGLWLLDAGNNTSMEPYRALLSDRLPKAQLARGFLTQAMFVGGGAVLANLSLFFLQGMIVGEMYNGVPYWMLVCFTMGVVVIVATMLISMLRTKEIKPTETELAAMATAPKGLVGAVREIASAVKDMPIAMHKIGVSFMFQWYAMFIYWQFVAVSLGESLFKADPVTGGKAWDETIGWTGLVNATYAIVTMIAALFLIRFCQKFGAKRLHATCLTIGGAGLIALSQASAHWMSIVPMIGLGIAWASIVGIPSLMVVSMVPKERTGVYLGILNMMIVVPMLIESVTFGWIFEHLLGGKGANAILLAGVLFGLGAISMLWVNDPDKRDESPIVPIGAKRKLSVYDRVIVGTDGTPTSVYAVDRAADVAASSEARLIVVSAYSSEAGPHTTAAVNVHRDLHGEAAAKTALARSITTDLAEDMRHIEQRAVAGSPAQVLMNTAAQSPASLIVVGNRGLGAVDGQLLGSVPGEVVKNATCDVLVVQTSAIDDRNLDMA